MPPSTKPRSTWDLNMRFLMSHYAESQLHRSSIPNPNVPMRTGIKLPMAVSPVPWAIVYGRIPKKKKKKHICSARESEGYAGSRRGCSFPLRLGPWSALPHRMQALMCNHTSYDAGTLERAWPRYHDPASSASDLSRAKMMDGRLKTLGRKSGQVLRDRLLLLGY